MPAIPANTLLNEVKCYACYGGSVQQLLKLALLRRKLLVGNPTADVSAGALLEYAKCYGCYGASLMDLLELALLDQISSIGGTPAAGIEIQGLNLVTTVSSSSIVSGSITPSANALLLATIINGSSGGIAVSTVVGNGLTWVKIANVSGGATGANSVEIWRAMGAAPTAGAVTVTFGSSVSCSALRIVQITGVKTGGTNGSAAIVQSVTNSATGVVNPSVTLAAIGGSGANMVLASGCGSITGGYAAETNWTLESSTNAGCANGNLFTVYRNTTTDNTVVVTQVIGSWGIIGVEIAAA